MQLLSIGINHHTAPVALRERVAFPLEQIRPALQMLKTAWQWLEQRSVVPVIRHIHTQADALRRVELERAQKMLTRGDDPAAVLEALSQALTSKFIHGPTHAPTHACGDDRDKLVDLLSGFYSHSASPGR